MPPPFSPVGVSETVADSRSRLSKFGSRANDFEQTFCLSFLRIALFNTSADRLNQHRSNFIFFIRGMVAVRGFVGANPISLLGDFPRRFFASSVSACCSTLPAQPPQSSFCPKLLNSAKHSKLVWFCRDQYSLSALCSLWCGAAPL